MRWRRLLVLVTFGMVGLAVLVYLGDFTVFRVRVAAKRNPYGAITVQRFDAVLKKNGKTEFFYDPPQPETCVHAVFPHDGFAPCWYLNRHKEQGTNLDRKSVV